MIHGLYTFNIIWASLGLTLKFVSRKLGLFQAWAYPYSIWARPRICQNLALPIQIAPLFQKQRKLT